MRKQSIVFKWLRQWTLTTKKRGLSLYHMQESKPPLEKNSEFERRKITYTYHVPERRKSVEKRSGFDRRSGEDRRKEI